MKQLYKTSLDSWRKEIPLSAKDDYEIVSNVGLSCYFNLNWLMLQESVSICYKLYN